jgi:hypothetical protein
LPFPKWCATDWQLLAALDEYEASLCTCGRPTAVCHNDALHWQLLLDVCQPSAAIDQFYADHEKDELPKGLRVSARLLVGDERAGDPFKALAEDDIAALRARHPAAFSVSASDQGDEATHDQRNNDSDHDQ